MNLKKISTLGKTITKAEQRTILGGNVDELSPGTGSCAAFRPCTIPGDHDDTCEGGDIVRNVSKDEAKAFVASGGRWCCEGCGGASWYY
ncbi:hypothetical protein IMCC3317_43010 [Kordia antarctica]|uniref:Uncharacterized protein n=1 Tax=Kordia antarctica TaxID=1218801 RepID=A0A7L4ZQW1_9FLAO|nr:hypothetical protein [Kordia antarctica]QHI38901.1 hypothetical protein IMCC3317_43010 [Kordia antarctica]